jgi:hypothetical protein
MSPPECLANFVLVIDRRSHGKVLRSLEQRRYIQPEDGRPAGTAILPAFYPDGVLVSPL